MKRKKRSRIDRLLAAWDLAHEYTDVKVIAADPAEARYTEKARDIVYGIDKEEWRKFAEIVIGERPYIDEHELAEKGASRFVNEKLNTTSLKVEFGGML